MVDLHSRPFYLSLKEEREVRTLLSSLSEDEKIGQLFLILGDLYSPAKIRKLIQKDGIGGVLLRPADSKKIRKEYEALDALAKIPLFHAANLEDGATGAILDGTRFSSEMGIAATGEKAYAKDLARIASSETKKLGINITFSPEADIDSNPLNPITNERTYGSDPETVRSFVAAEIEGFEESGLLCAVKHFPGDGRDYRDQHLHPTYNDLSYVQWMKTYGKVYGAAVKAGVPAVMAGHIVAPKVSMHLDPALSAETALPATLSPELLQGLLRGRLGFNGLIFSDATIMGGFDMAMKREEALPRAIQSGIDVLVFNTDIDEDLAYLKDGLHRGLLTEERLDDAVLRILAMKKRMEKLKKIVPEKVPARIRKEVADRSITLVKSKDDALPLTLEKYESIELIPLGNDHCPDGSITERVKTRFEKAGYPVTVFDIDQVEMHGPKKLNPKVLHLYLCNEEAASNRITVRISWQKKHALDGPRFVNEVPYVFVSFANPYHLQDIPRVKDFVNAYTADKDVIDALVDKLLGKSDFKGRSPVDAFCGLEDTRI